MSPLAHLLVAVTCRHCRRVRTGLTAFDLRSLGWQCDESPMRVWTCPRCAKAGEAA